MCQHPVGAVALIIPSWTCYLEDIVRSFLHFSGKSLWHRTEFYHLQAEWLQTSEIPSLTVLEARSLKVVPATWRAEAGGSLEPRSPWL